VPTKPKNNARAGAFEILTQIEEGGYTNVTLDAYLEGPGKELSGPDKRLLTELVQGVVKRRLTLDWIIDQRMHRQDRLQAGPRILLRLGLYQLCFLDRVPARAATFETVELARRRYHGGVASLVNGVLRGYLRDKDELAWPDEQEDPAEHLSVCYSHPRWMVERWLERYGFENTKKYCAFNNEPPQLWLRTNTLKITPQSLAEVLDAEGRRTRPGDYAPEAFALLDAQGIRGLAAYRDGLFAVQDESSMMAAHGLRPAPGQRVLDVCAAPGGKTTHLAQLMGDEGEITAWDVHPHRVELIRENQRRLGIRCIEAAVRDAAVAGVFNGAATPGAGGDGSSGSIGSISSIGSIGSVANRRLFDCILVDAPCSGLGVLRRRADARWNRQPDDIPALAAVQEKLLQNALAMLAPGGRLLYSTCTTEPEENRLLVEKVLGAHPGYRKGSLSLPVVRAENRALLPEPATDWDMQFLPFRHGMEGFYMALLERNEV